MAGNSCLQMVPSKSIHAILLIITFKIGGSFARLLVFLPKFWRHMIQAVRPNCLIVFVLNHYCGLITKVTCGDILVFIHDYLLSLLQGKIRLVPVLSRYLEILDGHVLYNRIPP